MALAAGLLSAGAQVYSANVVGYYNVVVPANGYALIANQLTNTAAGGNNVNNVLTSGAISDVNGLNNTTLYFWNGAGYNQYQYFTGSDADNYFFLSGSVNGWYDGGGNLATASLAQGKGHFIRNFSASPITNTIVGQVPQGSYSKSVINGFDTYSIIPPVSTNYDGSFANFPGTSDVNGINNDVYYKWNGAGFNQYQYFTGSDADNYFFISGSTAGWYDGGGNNVSQSTKPKVGEGFFIRHFGSAVPWNYSFSVQ